MKKPVFFLGFGISVLLIGVCVWYAFASPEKRAILDAFDVRNRGWYVHLPSMYNFCLLTFAILNLPAIVVLWVILFVLDATMIVPAAPRAVVTFVLLISSSGAWWALIARWRGSRDRANSLEKRLRKSNR
jgi:hypothetical protein